MVKITDETSAQAWLREQRREVCVALAARSALRAAAGLGAFEVGPLGSVALPVFRATLTSGAATTCPSSDVRAIWRTARAAASFVSVADGSHIAADGKDRAAVRSPEAVALSAAYYAALAVDAPDADPDRPAEAVTDVAVISAAAGSAGDAAAYSALSRDADGVAAGETLERLFRYPVWRDMEEPVSLAEARAHLLTFLDYDPAKWGFWARWYRGMFDGQPMDWGVQRAVALIPDDVWKAGPEAVARRIVEIEAEYEGDQSSSEEDAAETAEELSARLPLIEVVEFNAKTNKFRRVAVGPSNPDLLATCQSRVDDALDDVLANSGNGISETSRETRVLRRTLSKYGNDVQRIEMDFTDVHAGLTRQILTDELPASEANVALQTALAEGFRAARASDPEIAKTRKILNEQAIAELPETAFEEVQNALPILRAISEPGLADGWQEDIAEMLERERRPSEIRRSLGGVTRESATAHHSAEERFFSRVAQIGVILKQTPEVIHRIDGSAGWKGVGIVATVATLVSLGRTLLS